MEKKDLRVIAIGYGRDSFVAGTAEQQRMIRCALETRHYDMIVFTKKAEGFSRLSVTNELTIHPTNSSNRLCMLFDAYTIAAQLLKIKKEDTVILAQDPFETAFIGLILRFFFGVRVVIQEHGDFFGHPYWRRESVLNRIRYVFGLFALAAADSVRVVSRRIAVKLQKRNIPKLSELPVAIDVTPFLNSRPDAIVRSIFGEETFVFVTVARLVPQKNLELLIDSFVKVFNTNKNVRLLIVGKGNQEAALRQKVSNYFKTEEHIVVFLPWSDNVPGIMKASDCYVLSSHYEGWGRVLIEAMVAGLPLVTTDVGCAREVVVDGDMASSFRSTMRFC
jgi:glycosyltransferase involved in cell wall biosynthesis